MPELTVEADEGSDLIWGEGPKAWVVVNHGWDHGAGWQWDEYLLPVDGYLLDVAHFGAVIEKGDEIGVTYPAPNGNRVSNRMLWPRMGANYGQDRVSGNYPVGHTFWITVTDGGGLVKATAMATTAVGGSGPDGGWVNGFETGGGDWFPLQPDLLPYDRVDYRADDGYSNAVRLGAIDGELDVDADTASGTVTVPWLAGETLDGGAGFWGFTWRSFTLTLDTTGMDDYFVDFTPDDVEPGWQIDVFYDEPDLDHITNLIPEQEGHIQVRAFYGRDYAEGNTTPGADVTVTVYDSQGNWKDEDSTTAGAGGEYYINGLTADMVPGDWLAATSSDGTATSLQVIQIEGSLDLEEDTVTGTMVGPGADFPAEGMVRVYTPDDQWFNWPLEIEADGSYFLDMTAEHDVVPGDEVQVFYGPWTWNQVERDFYAESIRVYLPIVVRNY